MKLRLNPFLRPSGLALAALTAALGLTTDAHAATITWGAANMITGDAGTGIAVNNYQPNNNKTYNTTTGTADIYSTGTSVFAINLTGVSGDTWTNRVTYFGADPFKATTFKSADEGLTQNDVTLDMTGWSGNTRFTDASPQGSSYGGNPGWTWDTLSYMRYVNGTSESLDLSGLTTGQNYAAQYWVQDNRTDGLNRTLILDGQTTLDYNNNSGVGVSGAGQWAVGTFTADGATQSINITANDGGSVQVNQFQLRATETNVTWNNDANNMTWSKTDGNWSVGPGWKYAANNAIFGTTGVGTVNLAAETIGVHNVTFNSAGYTIAGNTLTLNNSTITTNADATISSTLAGTTGLIKAGTGTLKLTATESYTGATVVNQGILELAGPNAGNSGLYNSSGITINNGGQILVSASNALFGWNVGNVGTVTINAGGSMNTSNGVSVTFRAPLTLNGGTLASGTPLASYGSWQLFGDVTASGTVASTISAQDVYLKGTRTFTVSDAAGNLNVTGYFSSNGALTKAGSGTMTLSGANTYTGATTISEGTLKIGNGGSTGSLYSPTFSGGNLTFGSTGAITNNGALVYNISGGAVNVNKAISGTGTVSVTGDQAVNFAAGTSISSSGSQTYSATATSGRYNGFNLTDNATVTLTSTAGNISMTGMLGTANGNTGKLTLDTSAGNGNVTLNTPTGIYNVDFGLDSLTVTAGTGTITLGTVNGLDWRTVNTISLTGGAINSTANMTDFTTLNVENSGASAFSGKLTASGGALTKAGTGTLTLSGANTYTGVTQVNDGTLKVSSSIGNSAVTVNNTGTVLASGTTGTIGKSVTVNNGAILAAGGKTAVGSATVGSDGLNLTAGSIFEWDLASSASGTRGTQYDAVDVSGGNLTGSGAIFKVVLNSGNFGETFWNTSHDWTDIFTASNAFNLSTIFSEIQWNGNSSLTYGTTTAPGYFSFTNSGTTLTWNAVPEPTSALVGLLITAGLLRRRRA